MEGANWKLTTAKDIVEMTPKVELLEVSLLKKKKKTMRKPEAKILIFGKNALV